MGVERDRAFEKLSCQPVFIGAKGPHVLDAAKQAFIGRQALRAFMRGSPDLRLLDSPGERGDDVTRDLVLYLEQCANLTIEALRPEVVSGSGIDQLHSNT